MLLELFLTTESIKGGAKSDNGLLHDITQPRSQPRPAFRHFQYGKAGRAWERG